MSITCHVRPEDSDGGGSSVQKFMAAYAIAKRLGVQYIHTEMVLDKHNRGDMSPEEWNQKWNYFIPFPVQKPLDTLLLFQGDVEYLKHLLKTTQFPIGLENHHPKSFIDRDPSIMEDARADLRMLYNSVERPLLYYDPKKINIAVHVRRFSDTDNCHYHLRKLYGEGERNDNYFYNNIKILKEVLAGKDLVFHIYSEGDESLFSKFLEFKSDRCDVQLHVRENVFISMHHMINADIFIASVSSLSYIVHVLRTKPTIAHPEQIHRLMSDTIYDPYRIKNL